MPQHCFPNKECDTNNLSQIVFVKYGGSVICISGDVEKDGWEQLLAKEDFKTWLAATNVFVAAHHGRENGYAEEIFEFCFPECIIFSDKRMVHGTQEGMVQAYENHVKGNGVFLREPKNLDPRKVLTTRKDGHIWLRFNSSGTREYRTFAI